MKKNFVKELKEGYKKFLKEFSKFIERYQSYQSGELKIYETAENFIIEAWNVGYSVLEELEYEFISLNKYSHIIKNKMIYKKHPITIFVIEKFSPYLSSKQIKENFKCFDIEKVTKYEYMIKIE